MKHKHLSLEERYIIENGLNERLSFKQLGKNLNKSCTTISREIKNHYITKNTGGVGRSFNNCQDRSTCPNRGKNCKLGNCSEFKKEECLLLEKPPYVCNGCKKKHQCTLTKRFYSANYSHNEYRENLSEIRSGLMITQKEIDYLNTILNPLIKEQGQSVHHALQNNKNKIMYSEKTIYKLIDLGVLDVRNIDLPRKVRYKKRNKKQTSYKIDKRCLEGRRYEDFQNYMKQYPDPPIVEMDTVEGIEGGKVLLTLHFVSSSFMLAFIRDHNDAQSVIDIFNDLQTLLGIDKFKELFVLILTDNGSEFSNPTEIEIDKSTGEKRTQIFYCHPSSPEEKGAIEVNHELIRRVLPKGTSFDHLTQDDINKLLSNINSYTRKKLNDRPPYLLFSTVYGKDTIDKLGIKELDPNQVCLLPKLLKK